MKVLIVGLGLIGGSYAKAFKKYTDFTVYGIDTEPTVIEYAISHGSVDKAATNAEIKSADLIIVSLYPQAAADFINTHKGEFKDGAVVTDSCGVKRSLYEKLDKEVLNGRFSFIGSHPMAGREYSGFDYSDADLFSGASLVITDANPNSDAAKFLRDISLKIGFGNCTICTPETHDKMIAYTSQLPHILACSYISDPLAVNHNGYSAGSFQDVTRVAFINDVMWSELFLDNADNLYDRINELIKNLTAFKDALSKRDRDELRWLMIKSRELKEKI